MRRAADRGCRLFDFGRSKLGTGAFAFKHNWGFPEPAALSLPTCARAPACRTTIRRTRNTGMFIAAWKRLPLPVANTVGPLIVRGLG